MKFNYDVILRARKSRKSRKADPFTGFIDKFFIINDLFEKMHRKTKNKEILQECRGQDIIGVVSALEVYFKDVALLLLEKGYLKEEDVIDKEMKVDLLEVKEIIESKIKICELVLWQYDFSNLSHLERFFSRGFKITFMTELKKIAFKIDEKKGFLPIEIDKKVKDDLYLDKDFYVNIERILNIRNNLVHDFDPKFKLTKKDVEEFNSNIFEFVFFVDTFVFSYLIPKIK